METHKHDLSNLFRQLGHSGEAQDIDTFVAGHRLGAGVALAEAPFWTPVQAKFLVQAIAEDSDWAAAADALALRLA